MTKSKVRSHVQPVAHRGALYFLRREQREGRILYKLFWDVGCTMAASVGVRCDIEGLNEHDRMLREYIALQRLQKKCRKGFVLVVYMSLQDAFDIAKQDVLPQFERLDVSPMISPQAVKSG